MSQRFLPVGCGWSRIPRFLLFSSFTSSSFIIRVMALNTSLTPSPDFADVSKYGAFIFLANSFGKKKLAGYLSTALNALRE